MKRETTIGQTRYKVWRLTTGRVLIDECIVEFDSPNDEWICDPNYKWGKKSAHNKTSKATGLTNCSKGFNRQIIFKDLKEAEDYAELLRGENLMLVKDEKGNNQIELMDCNKGVKPMTMYDHPSEIPEPDELAICIALIQGAKIRAEKHISNPWGLSQLNDDDQAVMDAASESLDKAVEALESLRIKLQK